ncbi:carboxypeptidase-like regulatory domain-containing protein [Bacteroidota bacterium]
MTKIKQLNNLTLGLLMTIMFCNTGYSFNASESGNITLYGYLKDSGTGEPLIGATVYIQELSNGTVTNTYGFYSLTLPEGTYTIDFSYIGYATITRNLELLADQRHDLELEEELIQIDEVVVRAKSRDHNVTSTEMSVEKLDMKTIQRMPAFMGEVDVIKSIQLLPGVSTVGEGASGFNVRGGSVGQNLVLLDEAPVYNSSHVMGFFSVFNPDAVKDVKLYKGGIPALYGGRIASILDIKMKEGNTKQLGVQGGIGTVFSRLTVEAPIVKDKGSFIIAGRRSYADVLARTFTNALESGQALNFWDLTLKANYTLGDKDRLYLSGYFGQDKFMFTENQGFSWGNRTATLRWNHLVNKRMFFNLTSYFSDYTYELMLGEETTDRFEWDSRIRSTALKPEFTYSVNTKNKIYFGGELLYYRFDPANATFNSAGQPTNVSLDPKHAYEMAAYIGNNQTITSKLGVEYGLRFSTFMFAGPGNVYSYQETEAGSRKQLTGISVVGNREPITYYKSLEPRVSIRYQIDRASSVKASYNRMAQYLHLISNTTASNPLNIWMPSTNNIEPQMSNAFGLGYFRNFRNNGFEASVELYYRSTVNQMEYIDGAELFINEFIEGDLLSGVGRAYGMEASLKKNAGRFTGWIGYTLGRTEMKVEGINQGDWYPTRFDQKHNLSLTGAYQLNDRLSLSANFSYITGTPTTFPTSRLESQGYVVPHNAYESRNNIRIEDYHRLDLSVRLDGKKVKKNGKTRKNEDYWVFGAYNVYAHKNPFSIYFSQGTDRIMPGQPVATKGTKMSIIGSIIPSISYNFKF